MNRDKHISIEVKTGDKTRVKDAKKLLGLGFVQNKTEHQPILSFLDTHTEIRRPTAKVGNGFKIDFSVVDRRVGSGNLSKNQPLSKAIGLSNNTVVDATAGFCGDAVRLALMGFRVTAIERSPIISVLLRDGIRRAKEDEKLWAELDNNLRIIECDSIKWLEEQRGFDVVFIDPMFPLKKKSSPLPPGHIQLLSQIVGRDSDADHLVKIAMGTNSKRVVVKRPNYAPLAGNSPVAIHKGKQVRYEVYHPTGL
ncbi:class I SAM-dependent methyltransferase [PVC group bacterium]|nr:class I SAM-dependent methyltransferase [PVC group bacterium]